MSKHSSGWLGLRFGELNMMIVHSKPNYKLCEVCLGEDVGVKQVIKDTVAALQKKNRRWKKRFGDYCICRDCGYILEHMISKKK